MNRMMIGLCAALVLAALFPVTANAQNAAAPKFPSKSVRIVVGFGAGGGTDLAARAIGQKLSDAFGTSFIVDNRPGAATIVASEYVAKAPRTATRCCS